jgi:hypothetical protein
MNVMEEAPVDIKESSATLISNQQQDKTEVVNEINKWKRSMNQSSGNINTSELFEKKLKGKVYSFIIRVKLMFAHLCFLFLLLRNNFTPQFTI